MTSTRTGSAFLLCLALASLAVVVGYLFLRGAARQEMSGKSELLIGLAQDAARSGVAHATEQILIDYNAGSLQVATGSGSATFTPAPTFLDGPFRAPFVSTELPNRLGYSTATGGNDVAEENNMIYTLIRKTELSYAWWHDYQGGYGNQSGCMIYDARGRWVEVNYHNATRPTPVSTNPVPVVATNFIDPNAAMPERSDGLFLDENLRLLTSGTVEERRRKARYRLRYAVGVEDLSSHLLTNPRASMNLDWKDPNNDYRDEPQWLDRSAYVMDNMTSTWANSRALSLRMGHIFRGRGNTNNADRSAPAGPRQGLPATFPMMFRTNAYGYRSPPWYGNFCISGGSVANMGGRLYSFDNSGSPQFEDIAANPAGGEILTPVGQFPSKPYVHALVGPQYSWFNQVFALQGATIPGWRYDGNGDGQAGDPAWIEQLSFINTLFTPFGRRLEASNAAPANWTWYQGRVDTPWQINLLTAPPQVTSEMLLAYIPPHLKTLHYIRDDFYRKTGDTPGPNSVEIYGPLDHSVNGSWDYSLPGLDILNDQISSGFAESPAPSSTVGATLIKPDYYQDPPDPRPIPQLYPGPLSRGDSDRPDEGSDDLGKDIDVDVAYDEGMQIGWCTHTYNPLLYFGGSDKVRIEDENPWTRWKIVRRIDTGKFTYKYSYFWDLLYAMTTTLSYARATWVQYPNTVFDPSDTSAKKGFSVPSLRDPLAFDTIEEIDALFLRQMGESYTAPGTPCSERPVVSNRIPAWPQTDHLRFSLCSKPVSNTIRSLVASDLLKTPGGVSSDERAKVMERMLNDFRMSFFGSSPKYRDFRPLDFDGNGRVNCSCYDVNPAASVYETRYMTSRWKLAVGSGQGPAPTPLTVFDPKVGPNPWFTVTGCFYIGKSHFYRIFTRGEVYDNLLKKPVAQQDLETVLAVDPEGPQFPAAGRISPEQRAVFQQFRYNESVSEMPLQMR